MGKDVGHPPSFSARRPDFRRGQLRSTEDLAQVTGSGILLTDFILAAGGGTRIGNGSSCSIEFVSDTVIVDSFGIREHVPYSSILELQVSGSTVRTNLGVFGGGFGVIGAAEGMLAATVINTLTARTRRYAVLRITTRSLEYIFSSDARDGSDLALSLTPVQVKIRQAQQASTSASHTESSVADELTKLARLRDEGILTDEEFAAAKAKLLGR